MSYSAEISPMGLRMGQKKGSIINTFRGGNKGNADWAAGGPRPAPAGWQGRVGRPGFCVEFKAPSES